MLGLEYLLRRSGPLSMAPSQFGLFACSGVRAADADGGDASDTSGSGARGGGGYSGRGYADRSTPDLQFHAQPLSLDDLSNPSSLHPFPGLTLSVCNLRPTSRGAVTLTGPDTAKHPPNIDPNYLSTARDRCANAPPRQNCFVALQIVCSRASD